MGKVEIIKHGNLEKVTTPTYMFGCNICGCEFKVTGDCCTIERRPNGTIYCSCPECGSDRLEVLHCERY